MSSNNNCQIESTFHEPSEFVYGNTSVPLRIFLSLIMSLLMVFSFIGNACTCAVIIREKNMKTPTNYYLFNLAITDLAVSLFTPIDVYLLWSPSYKHIATSNLRIHFLIWDLLSNCNVLTILTFTIERYLVITKPFLRQKLAVKRRIFVIILINWVISSIFAVLNICYIMNWEKILYVYWFSSISGTHKAFLVAFSLLVFFIIPMSIIIILYILIAIKLKSKKSETEQKSRFGKQSRSKAVKLLAAVATSFFVCWSPYFVQRILMIIPELNYNEYETLWKIFIYLSAVNSYISTAVNPILYSLMSRKFRQAFKDLLNNQKPSGQHLSSGNNVRNI